jgi:hypothetical protein
MATDPPAPDPGAPFCRWCEHTTDDCGFPGSDLPPCCIPCGYPLEDCALRTDIETLKAERGQARSEAADAMMAHGLAVESLRYVEAEGKRDLADAERRATRLATRLAAVEPVLRAYREQHDICAADPDEGFDRCPCEICDAAVVAGAVGAGEATGGC